MNRLSIRDIAAVLLTVIPWMNPITAGPSAATIPWLVSAACGAGLLALASAGGGAQAHRTLIILCGVVVAWAAFSQSVVPDAVPALAAGLTLICVASSSAADGRTAEAVRFGLLAAALLSALAGLVQYFGLSGGFAPWIDYAPIGEAYGNLRQPNQYATLCWLGVAVVLWGLPRWPFPLSAVAIVLLAAGSASSVSRTGVLQGLALTILSFVWRDPRRRERLQLCVVAALAYFGASMLLPVLLEAFSGVMPARTLWTRLNGAYGCSSRTVLWSNVARLIGQRPLTGWGWGELDYAHFVTLYTGPRFCEILDNAHNLPLHIAVELGFPASMLLCLGGVAWCWRQRPWSELDSRRQLAWAVLAVVGVHSMLEYPLWYGPFQIAVGAALGWLLKDANQARGAGPGLRWAGIAFVAVLLSGTAYAAWDYWRVSQAYLPPTERRATWRADPLSAGKRSWLFAAQARFAELTLMDVTRENAPAVALLAREMLHYSPEPKVVERLIEADTLLGQDREAVAMLARLRAGFPGEYERWREEQRLPPNTAGPRIQD